MQTANPTASPLRADSRSPRTRNSARRTRALLSLLVLALALVFVVLVSTGLGAVRISIPQVFAILAQKIGWAIDVGFTMQQSNVLWAIRVPRVLFAVLFGAGLAVSGASIQGLFRNPLADPGLIGVSSGAALTSVIFIVAVSSLPAWWRELPLLPVAGFAGGLLATLLVYAFGRSTRRSSIATMLLAGIAISAFANACTGLVTFVANDAQLRSIAFWMLGSLGGATWHGVYIAAPPTLLAILAMASQSRSLNALLLGEEEAQHLGYSVVLTKRIVITLSAVLVGVAVAAAGIIGFVGLVVPHLLRLLIGPDHRYLLPGSALLGGLLLCLADLLCRVVVAPAEIPIGVVTAIIGAPFFLWLIARERKRVSL
jgi:iron complex transport system permease protein